MITLTAAITAATAATLAIGFANHRPARPASRSLAALFGALAARHTLTAIHATTGNPATLAWINLVEGVETCALLIILLITLTHDHNY